MDPVEPSPRNGKDPSRKQERLPVSSNNASSTGRMQQSESHGRQLSSSSTPSRSLGQPRSNLPREGRISSEVGSLCPSVQHSGGPGIKGILGGCDSSFLMPPFLHLKKRPLRSPQLYGHSRNGPNNNSGQPVKMPHLQPKRSSTPPPVSPAKTGSGSHVLIAKSAQPSLEGSVVDLGMNPHNSSMQPLKMPQLQPNKRPASVSLSRPNKGLRSHVTSTMSTQPHLKNSDDDVTSTMSTQPHLKNSDDDVSMRPNNSSKQPVKVPELQAVNSQGPASLSHPNKELRSHVTNTMQAQPPLKFSDEDVSMRPNNSSKQLVKVPGLQPGKSPGSASLSPPGKGLRSHVTNTVSAQHPLKCSNIDVNMKQRENKDDILSSLSVWKSARKRLHSNNPADNVEEVGNVTRKKTRLDWGQGLARYEKEKREKDLMNARAIGANGDLRNSSTSATEKVVCPAILHNFSHGCSPLKAISASGDLGSSSTNMTKMIVSAAAGHAVPPGCSPPSGAKDDLDNNTLGRTKKAVCLDACGCSSPQVGVSDDLGISTKNKTRQTSACEAAFPSSFRRCNAPQASGANCVVCPNDVSSFSRGRSPPQGDNSDLSKRGMSMTETVICPSTVPASSEGCSLPPDGSFPTLMTVQDAPHKLISQGWNKIQKSSAPAPGNVLDGEMIAPPSQETSPITSSNQAFGLTYAKVEGPDLRNSNENRSSDEEIRKHEQGILAGGTNDISFSNMDCTNCITQSCSMLNEDESQAANDTGCGGGENYPAAVRGLSGQDTLTRIFVESFADKLEYSTTDGEHNINSKEASLLDTALNESNDGKMQFNKENPKSVKKCGIVNNGAELSGEGLVQQQNDSGTIEIDTIDNGDNVKRDERNPPHCIPPRKISGSVLSCNVDSMEAEKNDTISSPDGNDITAPPMQISNEAPEISLLSSTSGAADLQTVNWKSSDVKIDVDLNIPLDVAPVDVYSSDGGASADVDAPGRTTQIDLNIPLDVAPVDVNIPLDVASVDLNIPLDVAPVDVYSSDGGASADVDAPVRNTQIDLNILDPASMDDVSNDRGQETLNLGFKSEKANDLIHVQKHPQSQTEITKDPANQTRCVMLFGKVISQVPSSEIKQPSMQDNQIHGCSRNMESNMTVPFTARSYPSGPWCTWSSVPSNLCQQSVFSNPMLYGPVNGSADWPFHRSAFDNWRQQPHSVSVAPYSTMRGGVLQHLRPAERSSSSLFNFNPSQQQRTSGALNANRMVIGYLSLPDTNRPQAPGPITLHHLE